MNLLKPVLGILLLGFIVYGAGKYGTTAQYQVQKLLRMPGASVQGAAIKNQVTDRLKSDAASGAATAKKDVMAIKVSDVIGFFGRVRKIGEDMKHMTNFVASQAGDLTKTNSKLQTIHK